MASMMQDAMPTSLRLIARPGYVRQDIDDMMMIGSISNITRVKEKEVLAVSHDRKLVQVAPMEAALEASENEEVPDFKAKSGTREILGYSCSHYEAITNQDGAEIVIHIYSTNEIEKPDVPTFGGSGTTPFTKGVEGFPLMMVMEMRQGGELAMTMTFEATNISTEMPAVSMFEKPDGYSVEKRPKGDFDFGMSGFGN